MSLTLQNYGENMKKSTMQTAIAKTLFNAREPIGAKDISIAIDVNYKTCYGELTRMIEQNVIEKLDKTYSITDFGINEFGLKNESTKSEPKVDLLNGLKKGFEKVTTAMAEKLEPKIVEIVKHDAPIQYVPINEKTVNEIKNHVNGSTPDYYKGKSMQVFDVLDEFLTVEQNQGFFIGNIIKYVVRFRGKNGKDDLLKARSYIDKLIESL